MSVRIIRLSSLKETEALGLYLGQCAEPGDVICLDGDLGAGKTAITQAIAKGLEVPDSCYVTSPSFAILHEYPGRLPLYHMDFYRLSDESEVLELGFDEFFYLKGLTVIEWSLRAEYSLPESRLTLEFTIIGEQERNITIKYTESWKKRVENLVIE
jgi:tRNA threonylcarbamoyladenosine biosynthesis protein TsaE